MLAMRRVGRKADARQLQAAVAVPLAKRGFSDNKLIFDPNDARMPIPRNEGRSGVSGVVATVFGASGFLGRYVVNRLGRIGSQCVIPYRGDGMNVRHLKLMGDLGQIVPLPTPLEDADAVARAVDRSNVVINLVGSQIQTRNYSLADTNVKCSYRIAKLAKEAGVERFIQVSALGADPNSTSTFLATKGEGEQAVQSFYPDATIIRPAPIFGDEDKFINRLADMAHFSLVMPVLGNAQQRVQPVYVTDVAAAIMNAVGDTRSRGQVYELGGSETYTQEEIINMIYKGIYRSPTYTTFVPFVNAYATIAERLPQRWRMVTRDMLEQMKYDQVLAGGVGVKHLQDLGVEKPSGLSERLARILVRHGGQRAPARFSSYE